MPRRFPPRTIFLMFLTLAAFGWYYWQMRGVMRRLRTPPPQAQEVELAPSGGGDH